MIFNLVGMIKKNKLETNDIEHMNQCLQNEIIPYMIYKYPKSEDTEINLRLSNLIRNINNYESIDNDLVLRSGVRFEYCESGEYYSEIMQFLKYLIELPEEKIYDGEEKVSLGDCFYMDMNEMFRKVYDQEKMGNLEKFDYKVEKEKE